MSSAGIKMLNVGMLGITGYMGKLYFAGLLDAFKKKQLNLVILHRPSSDTSKYPKEVEKRVIDLGRDNIDTLRKKLEDFQIVISAISGGALSQQTKLIDALEGSKNLITFFPSEYATPFRDEDQASPFLNSKQQKQAILNYAKEKNVPTTVLKNASTPHVLFGIPPFSRFLPKENQLELYEKQGNGGRGLTSEAFSSAAIVHLLLNRLHDLPDSTISLVEIKFTSQDLIDTFTKVNNGQSPKIITYTEKQYQADLKKDLFAAMKAAAVKGLEVGCPWPGEILSGFEGWESRSLESYVRDYR